MTDNEGRMTTRQQLIFIFNMLIILPMWVIGFLCSWVRFGFMAGWCFSEHVIKKRDEMLDADDAAKLKESIDET